MDWCQDGSDIFGRLSSEGTRECTEAAQGLLHAGCVSTPLRGSEEAETKWGKGEKSEETIQLREKVLEGCEQLIWDFFNNGGQVVIYDANNGTRERRQLVAEKFDKAGIHVVMLGAL